MSDTNVLVAVRDGVGTVTLDRPKKRNAIDEATLSDLDRAFVTLGEDQDVRVVVLRGNGPMFSSGIDLGALASLSGLDDRPGGVRLREKIAWIQGIFGRLTVMEKPVVAALHGACLGLALELVLAADLRIAETGTLLGLPELVLGIIPDCGGTTRLSRLIGPSRAKRLILTGEEISAERAEAFGLVDEVTPKGGLDAATHALATTLARRSPLAVGLAKRVIDAAHTTDVVGQLALEGYAQSLILGASDFGDHLQRGMAEMFARAAERRREAAGDKREGGDEHGDA